MTYLKRFFEEKEIKDVTWAIQIGENIHYIDNETIIKLILNAPKHEQTKIANTLRKIDFHNGDILHYLKFLGEAHIRTQLRS